MGQVSQAEHLAHKEKVRTQACKSRPTCMGFFFLKFASSVSFFSKKIDNTLSIIAQNLTIVVVGKTRH